MSVIKNIPKISIPMILNSLKAVALRNKYEPDNEQKK